MRRGFSLLALGAVAIGVIAAGVFVTGGGAGTAATAAKAKINVTASEFKFVLSKKTVPAERRSSSRSPTRARSRTTSRSTAKKTQAVEPGQKTMLTVVFPKKGTIASLCTAARSRAGRHEGQVRRRRQAARPPPTTHDAPVDDAAAHDDVRASETLQGDPVAGKAVFAARTAVLRATRWQPPAQTATSVRTST